MKGKYRVVVSNNKLHYEFLIKRNITIVQGDSATGKTTLINMIRQHMNLGISSGIDVVCDVPCRILEGADWEIICRIVWKKFVDCMHRGNIRILRKSIKKCTVFIPWRGKCQ